MRDISDKELNRFFDAEAMGYDELEEIAVRLANEVNRRRRVEVVSRNIRLKTRRYFRV